MEKIVSKIVLSAFAALIVAGAASVVRAEKIETAVAGSGRNMAAVEGGIRKSLSNWWKRQVEKSKDKDWSNHPCLAGERRVDTGESGIACYPKESFSFSCTAERWEVIEGEGGPYRIPSGLQCTPPQGAGGSGERPDAPEAP